jgi:UDP-N-acetylglucosamine 2-epimerase (non-hydrolysing)
MKIMTVVGTRPEIIRLSEIIRRLDVDYEHILVHTGQNFDKELNENIFQDLGLRAPNFFLNCAQSSAVSTIGQILIKIEDLITSEKPDAFFVLGDTNSGLSTIAAKRLKVPVIHYEAGNRCFDEIVPEEINRKIIDHIADLNLTYSSISREYLLREGIHPKKIVKVGSPMNEVISAHKDKIIGSEILAKLDLTEKNYILVSSHREENIDSNETFIKVIESLNAVAETFNKRIIVSTHPRTMKRVEKYLTEFNSLIEFVKPLKYTDFLKLQMNAFMVISDSGTITEESNIMGFSAVNFRNTHERPEGDEAGSIILTGLNAKRLIEAISTTISHESNSYQPNLVRDYVDKNISFKVSRIISSFVNAKE